MTAGVVSLSKEVEFDAGHRVPDHASKCQHPHGHRYRLRVTCTGEVITEAGAADDAMLVDFGDLKRWMTRYVHDVLDHGYVHRHDDPVAKAIAHVLPDAKLISLERSPTAEVLAEWCWDQLEPVVETHWRGNLRLALVELWETPTSLVTFTRPGLDPEDVDDEMAAR